jgi:hypothetical protein
MTQRYSLDSVHCLKADIIQQEPEALSRDKAAGALTSSLISSAEVKNASICPYVFVVFHLHPIYTCRSKMVSSFELSSTCYFEQRKRFLTNCYIYSYIYILRQYKISHAWVHLISYCYSYRRKKNTGPMHSG